MKQVCPHCLASVTVPEDSAGRDVSCPQCGKSFPAPARYNPVVAAAPPAVPPPAPPPVAPAPTPAAPPPGLVPTALAPAAPPTETAPPGYTKSFAVVLSPRVLAWLPAVCMAFALLFTFFPWVGSYFGENAVYSQGPWRAAFGSVGRDFSLEAAATKTFPGFGAWLDKLSSDWELMLPFLLLLFAATVLAWADLLNAAPPAADRLPPPVRWVTTVWPHRAAITFGMIALALVLVLTQAARGFGMERAIYKAVREAPHLVEARQKAAGSAAEMERVADVMERQELDKYNLRRTTAYYLAVGMTFLAVAGIAVRAGLARRGTKPPPRIVVQY